MLAFMPWPAAATYIQSEFDGCKEVVRRTSFGRMCVARITSDEDALAYGER
jgi:hypothetical protein